MDGAEHWIATFAAAIVYFAEPKDKSLQGLRELLTNPKHIEKVIELTTRSEGTDEFLAKMGFQLTQFVDRELGSTLTTANRFLRNLDTPAIAASTQSSSFDGAELRSGKMTVYLILPGEYVRTQVGLLRLWLSSMFRAIIRQGITVDE